MLEIEGELAAFAGILSDWVPVSQLSLSSPAAEVKAVKKKKKDTGEKMTIPPPSDSFKKHYRRLEARAFKVLLGCATNSIMLDVQDTEGPAPTRALQVTPEMAQSLLCELRQQLQCTLRKATRSATP